MIIAISGSVGSGKTSLSKEISKETGIPVVHLNEIAQEFKIEEVKDIQTFDFDIDLVRQKVDSILNEEENIILEGHFAHLMNPEKINYLFVINRDLKELQKEYKKRKYNDKKIEQNLEVESFNLCFYEALEEGFEEEKVFCFENNSTMNKLVKDVMTKI